ncbi:fatty acid desaturase [Burkholderia ubonensis]|uniref:acyl-CoA desaturase n=1 Tax=Burkholderia ubonensis TaxID=101571 RepID=UPI00075E81CC|nr:fatty acid desaturase [Burkholderia ubonensis]KVD41151.1 fatty acid desaturase [Burkholderia ubonensis]KWI90337.1 fatty acid desaturase [Burkholderia ubonensis]
MSPGQPPCSSEGASQPEGAIGSAIPASFSSGSHGPARPTRISTRSTVRLDRRIAAVVTLLPALGTVAAIALWVGGYVPGAVELIVFAVFYFATALGLEVGFHRHVTHKAFKAKPWVRVALIALGSMGAHGPVNWWASTHRRHHSTSDGDGDPHSPHLSGEGAGGRLKGLYHSHMGWLFVGESTRPAGWEKYVPDLYQDPLVFKQHMAYYRWVWIGLALPPLICGLASRSWMGVLLGFLWGDMVRIFAVSHCIWALNSLCHVIGRRDFHTTAHDRSRNSLLLAIPTFGQGWHNNHHAFPASAFTGLHWWQIDPGGLLVRVLERLHLVYDVQRPSAELIEKKRIAP